jgi:uncharacterized membrane protein YhhN
MGVLSLAAAVLYWLRYAARETPGPGGAAIKTVSTLLPAMLLFALAPEGARWFWLMPLGLALGVLGDLCLALRGERAFLAGMAAFGAGHLAYAAALGLRTAELGFDGVSAGEGVALAALLGLVASTEFWLAPRTGALRWPVRAYVGLIGGMGVAAILLPAHPARGLLQAGAGLFLLSDLLLALRLFVVAEPGWQRGLSLMLWPAYWAGQVLIALGALALWAAGAG